MSVAYLYFILYLVFIFLQGFVLHSVAMLDVSGSSVQNFELAFSKDGRTFDLPKLSLQVNKQSRSLNAPKYLNVPFDVSYNDSQVYGFSNTDRYIDKILILIMFF